MLAELSHVEGSWPVLAWSLGCSGVLLGMGLKEFAMRKTAAIVAVCCAVLVCSSFAMPAFRQAFDSTVLSWRIFFETRPGSQDSQAWPDTDLRQMKRGDSEQFPSEIAHCPLFSAGKSYN